MNTTNAPSVQDQSISPLWVLVIILMVAVVHVFAIIIALSVKSDDEPKTHVLEAQILSNAQSIQMSNGRIMSHAPQAALHNRDVKPKFQPSTPPKMASTWQSSQMVYGEPTFSNDTYDAYEPMNDAVFDDEMTDANPPNTHHDNQTAQEQSKAAKPSSQDIKQAQIQATERIYQAWGRYADISDKQIKLTIHFDDTGNVTQIKVVGGDQELALNATAAIHDAAPFREVAGLTKTLTVVLGTVGMP
ncbi:MAG: cell envelope integrity protein TolA [Moraxella sp.]|nr:cell envelope integrity protein TolA [Moraxella sp.]